MELTVDKALQKGVQAHKAGKAKEADLYYTAILKAQPKHPDANHNMGVLAVGVGKIQEALPFFKAAIAANSSISQYWLSYIDALIELGRTQEAQLVFKQAKNNRAEGNGFDKLEKKLVRLEKDTEANPTARKSQEPPEDQLQKLKTLYTQGQHKKVLPRALELLRQFPKSINLYNIIGAVNLSTGKLEEAIECYKKAILIKPDTAKIYNNMAVALQEKGSLDLAMDACKKALSIQPDYVEAYINMGNALKEQGKLEEAIDAYTKALSVDPNYAEAYSNMGVALQEQGKLDKSIEAYNKALYIRPNYAEACWNLTGTVENISEAKNWVTKCLEADPKHTRAKLTLSALKFYEGDKTEFNDVLKSSLKDHPNTRSFAWTFSLPKLPPLHFHRWALFDHMTDLSKKDRPFYEFGVWRGEAFRYLINTFKKGYGFDTFEGIPEDWHNKKAGTYSSDGNVPKIKGGKFIVGKFEDTLPVFFAEVRPKASIINFDADLYSSTICALNFAKTVIDQHTILIFDEFLFNDNWEQDEYKALEEFCSNNQYTYEVVAVSFFTKQVAVKIVGI